MTRLSFMTFIERALRLCEARGIPQGRLADAAGVEHPRIPRWKAGKGSISLPQAVGIARMLGVSLDWLVSGEMGTAAPPPALKSEGQTISDDEKLILAAVQAFGLSRDEAMRRLAWDPSLRIPQVIGERDMKDMRGGNSNHQLPGYEERPHGKTSPGGRGK